MEQLKQQFTEYAKKKGWHIPPLYFIPKGIWQFINDEFTPKQANPVDALVIRNATETKRQMLRELGSLIRKMGRREGKKHGNYWYLEIGKGYYFGHDDYNNAVNFNKGGERIKYYGIDWGGFETKLETEDFEDALQLLKSFAKLSGVSV